MKEHKGLLCTQESQEIRFKEQKDPSGTGDVFKYAGGCIYVDLIKPKSNLSCVFYDIREIPVSGYFSPLPEQILNVNMK